MLPEKKRLGEKFRESVRESAVSLLTPLRTPEFKAAVRYFMAGGAVVAICAATALGLDLAANGRVYPRTVFGAGDIGFMSKQDAEKNAINRKKGEKNGPNNPDLLKGRKLTSKCPQRR